MALSRSAWTWRSAASERGPRLTMSPTNQSWSRSAEKRIRERSASSSSAQPCTSPMAKRVTNCLVQYAGNGEAHRGDRRVETLTVVGDHLVAPLHDSYRSLDDG